MKRYTVSMNMSLAPIAVVRGGKSHHYSQSLASGARLLAALRADHDAVDVLIDREGQWHTGGRVRTQDRVFRSAPVFLNAMHGAYGEDGTFATAAERFGVLYAGSRPLPSALSLNKASAQKHLSSRGIRMPIATVITHAEHTVSALRELFRVFPQPSVVKPVLGSASLGVSVARSFPEFLAAVEAAFRFGPTVLIEEYIEGVEYAVPVLETTRRESAFALHPVVTRMGAGIFSFSDKAAFKPFAPSDPELARMAQEAALAAHATLGLRHYSSVDVIIHPRRGLYVIDVNAQPSFAEQSPFMHGLGENGISVGDFARHIVASARASR
jgi:D-alanine-D-alanine ligase